MKTWCRSIVPYLASIILTSMRSLHFILRVGCSTEREYEHVEFEHLHYIFRVAYSTEREDKIPDREYVHPMLLREMCKYEAKALLLFRSYGIIPDQKKSLVKMLPVTVT